MTRWKRFRSQLFIYGVYAILAAMFWSAVFSWVTDAPAAKKLVLYADVPQMESTALAVELEKSLPEGIRMVQAHPFSYAMMNDGGLAAADLYIIRESGLEQYLGSQAAAEGYRTELAGYECLLSEGGLYGVKVYDAASGQGAAAQYITYTGYGAENEDCWLCFSAKSVHIAALGGGKDDAALTIALALMNLK